MCRCVDHAVKSAQRDQTVLNTPTDTFNSSWQQMQHMEARYNRKKLSSYEQRIAKLTPLIFKASTEVSRSPYKSSSAILVWHLLFVWVEGWRGCLSGSNRFLRFFHMRSTLCSCDLRR